MLRYYKNSLIYLFQRIQCLRVDPIVNLEDCLEIQETLISKIIYAEQRIRTLKQQIETSKKILGTKGLSPTNREEARQVKALITRSEVQIRSYRQLIYILKSVGDALAYIYIPRRDIRPLGLKQSAGFISGKEGFKAETGTLRRLFHEGIPTIMNDLTNCLRFGDLTAFTPNGYQLIEVKMGNHMNDRIVRQLTGLERIRDYLNEGQAFGLHAPGSMTLRRQARSEEKHYRDSLNEMLKQALFSGSYLSEVEKGVHYYISAQFDPKEISSVLRRAKDNMLSYYLNTFKFGNMGYYPFTLSFTNSEVLYNFYSGKLLFLIFLDRTVIAKKLNSHGLSVDFSTKGETALTVNVLDSTKTTKPLLVTQYGLSRVACEFLSLDWYLDEIIHEAQRVDGITTMSFEEKQ